MHSLISVIVPIYNVERYLPQCLDSILNQTYRHLEVILVNDGSTDRSGAIADEYASRDMRVSVIHKQNGGLSSARNAGMAVMRGDFVAFVDSDDWLESNAYEESLKPFLMDASLSVVRFGHAAVDEDLNKTYVTPREAVYDRLGILQAYATGEIYPCVWSSLYRREIISDLRFMEGRLSEDAPFTISVYVKNGLKVQVLSESYYNYRVSREGAITSSKREKCLSDLMANLSDLIDQKVLTTEYLPVMKHIIQEMHYMLYLDKPILTPELMLQRFTWIKGLAVKARPLLKRPWTTDTFISFFVVNLLTYLPMHKFSLKVYAWSNLLLEKFIRRCKVRSYLYPFHV